MGHSNVVEVKGQTIEIGAPLQWENPLGSLIALPWRELKDDTIEGGRVVNVVPKYYNPNEGRVFCDLGANVRAADRTIYVYLEPAKLDFGGLAFAPKLRLWPGAEYQLKKPCWTTPDLSRVGRGKWPLERAEIWELLEGASLYLVDPVGGIRVLINSQGRARLREATPSEVGDYLFARGMNAVDSNSRVSAEWAYESLINLRQAFPKAFGANKPNDLYRALIKLPVAKKRPGR